MLPRMLVIPYRVARKVALPLVRDCTARLKGFVSETGTTFSQATAAENSVPSVSPAMQDILAEFEATARLGHVPADALIGRLHAAHCEKLAQDRLGLIGLEQKLQGHLLRLDARYPAPLPPEPEKPLPPRGRSFGPISRDLRARPGTATRP